MTLEQSLDRDPLSRYRLLYSPHDGLLTSPRHVEFGSKLPRCLRVLLVQEAVLRPRDATDYFHAS